MTPESAVREKITRIWSQRRGRFVIVRVCYEARSDSATAQVLLLRSFEEMEDGY